MRVIHGIWAYRALWLWAEDSDLPAQAPPRSGRPSRVPRPHPFGCDVAVLADELTGLADPLADLVRKAVEDELTLRLPSSPVGPLASPELIRQPTRGAAAWRETPSATDAPGGAASLDGADVPGRTGEADGATVPGGAEASGGATASAERGAGRRPVLAGWRIPALTFEPSAALDLLARLAEFAATAGANGTARANGLDGAAGTASASDGGGFAGANGIRGTAGADGLSGAAGANAAEGGADRASRVEGTAGADGSAGVGRVEGTAGAEGTAAASGAAGAGGAVGSEVVLGGSVRYLAALARLAEDMARRGRVLPALVAESDGMAARWHPVLSGADAQRARELAAAMPPICRATDAAGEPPAQVLTGALDALADAAARSRLTGTSLVPKRGRSPARVPVAQRWLAALTAADGRVDLATAQDDAEAAELAAQLAAWRNAAQVPVGPVRTCFRLVEPEPVAGQPEHSPHGTEEPGADGASTDKLGDGSRDDGLRGDGSRDIDEPETDVPVAAPPDTDGRWRVEFALQSTDDPSLVMPGSDIWAGKVGWAVGGIRHPEEELLAGLGAAARLFPELDAELRTATPAMTWLDTAGAVQFLRQTAPLLSGAGFGVLLPDWARKARLGLRLTTRSRSTAAAGAGASEPKFGMQDLVDFRYELAVGDETLDPDELAELARLKIPLVRIRGQWVELDDRHLQAALRFLERRASGTMSAGDALLAGLRGEDDLAVVQVDADGWLGDLLSGQADRRLAPVPTPETFTGSLRPYQERGLAWMAFLSSIGLGGILADSMGLGKTIQLLALLAHERSDDSVSKSPTLLVCPMSLVGNWEQEAAKFTPRLRVHVHHGAGRLTGAELASAMSEADLVITTYAIAARDREALAGFRWARVVCDEAQNIKNSAARQAQAVRGLPADCRIALTGTPVENRLTELWSIMEFTNPGLLGSAEKFRSGYAVPIERHGDEEATRRLRRLTGPFILRRLKTDSSIISDLPDKLEMKVWCNLTAEQASLYQATVTDMLARIESAEEGIQRRGLVLATMAKLKQVCNHPAHLLGDGSRLPGRSGKLARLEEICDEIIADGEKALCFTQYAEFGTMLQPHLAARLGCPVLFLHGGTPKRRRDEMVARFTSETEPALFLLSLKAGGTGLNLTAANHVIHVDRWWNPAVEDQATDRAFRIGQRKDVQVRKFVCVGTVEERIDQMIEEKKALAESVVGTGESWLADMSVAELRNVINLSPEAVSE
jgi:SNF2 family DNA or RNA helicase